MKLRRLLMVFVAVLLISLAAVTLVSADDISQFEVAVGVSSSTAIFEDGLYYVEPGEEIEVTVSIIENPGVDSFEMHIKYNPEVVTPVYGSNGKVAMNGILLPNCDINDTGSEIILTRFSSVNNNNTTTSAGKTTIKFKVNDGACGTAKFELGTVSAVKSLPEFPFVKELMTSANKDALQNVFKDVAYTTHNYSLESTTSATCTSYAVEHYACTNCDATSEKVRDDLPMADHTSSTVPGSAATCTATGLTDGEICSACNTWIVEQTEIPMAEHTPVEVKGYEGTCIAEGLTDGIQCSVCQTWIEEQLPIRVSHNEFVEDENGNLICPICNVIVVERVPGGFDDPIAGPEIEVDTDEVETKAPEKEERTTEEPTTEAPTTEEKNGGCGSAIGAGSIVIIAISMIGAITFKRRRF